MTLENLSLRSERNKGQVLNHTGFCNIIATFVCRLSCLGYLLQHQRDTTIQKWMLAHLKHENKHCTLFTKGHTTLSQAERAGIQNAGRQSLVVTGCTIIMWWHVCHTCHTGVFHGPQSFCFFLRSMFVNVIRRAHLQIEWPLTGITEVALNFPVSLWTVLGHRYFRTDTH